MKPDNYTAVWKDILHSRAAIVSQSCAVLGNITLLAGPDVKLIWVFVSFSRLIPQMVGLLYVGSYDMPFAQMKVRETLLSSLIIPSVRRR